MLIPSIDLQGGRIVQLVQGERLAIASSDIDEWVDRFRGFARVQLIDLDAAKGNGNNDALVTSICQQLPCQVGGGIRTIERARALLDTGAPACDSRLLAVHGRRRERGVRRDRFRKRWGRNA